MSALTGRTGASSESSNRFTARMSLIRITSSNYDVSADGKRFLMIQEGDHDAPATEIRVVWNWSAELKRLTGAKKD